MADKGKITWTDGRGQEVSRPINYIVDIRQHVGEPGYALLAIAANTHLTVPELLRFLGCMSIGRSRNWVQKRRWLFQPPGTANATSPVNVDGKDARAREIMRMFPKLSVRDLTAVLIENGVTRSREWVRKHRCE
jgi:hypothetical protein